MNVLINNQDFELANDVSLEQALNEFGAKTPYAILYNDNFLPKSEHENIRLVENDKIEVISAIQGG